MKVWHYPTRQCVWTFNECSRQPLALDFNNNYTRLLVAGQLRRTKTKSELETEIEDLEAENQELQEQLDTIADIVGGDEDDDDEDPEPDDSDDRDDESDDGTDRD